MKVDELLKLLAVSADDPQGVIKRVYEWKFEAAMGRAKGFMAVSATLLAAAIAAYLKGSLDFTSREFFFTSGAALVCLGLGLVGLWRVAAIARQYTAAIELFGDLKSIQPFLVLYRQRRNGGVS